MESSLLTIVHRILVIMRSEINNENTLGLGKDLLSILQERQDYYHFCNLIKSKKYYNYFCYKYGDGVFEVMCTNKNNNTDQYNLLVDILTLALSDIIKLLEDNNSELAYAIIDSMHVLPEIYEKNDNIDLKKYWNIFVSPIFSRWKTDNSMILRKKFLEQSSGRE